MVCMPHGQLAKIVWGREVPFFGPGERLGRAWAGHTSLTLRKWAVTHHLVGPSAHTIAQKMRFDERNRAVVSAHAVEENSVREK